MIRRMKGWMSDLNRYTREQREHERREEERKEEERKGSGLGPPEQSVLLDVHDRSSPEPIKNR